MYAKFRDRDYGRLVIAICLLTNPAPRFFKLAYRRGWWESMGPFARVPQLAQLLLIFSRIEAIANYEKSASVYPLACGNYQVQSQSRRRTCMGKL